MTLDSTFLLKTASSAIRPLTQEKLLKGWPNQRIFTLEANDPKNPSNKKLQFFSKYGLLNHKGALPVAIHNGVWHQLVNPKEPALGEPLLSIHKYDIDIQLNKGKGKSIPESEDDITEDVQKALDQTIRQSPVAPNAIMAPWAGLLLNLPEMSTTTTTPVKVCAEPTTGLGTIDKETKRSNGTTRERADTITVSLLNR